MPIAVGVLLYSMGPVFVQASSVSGAVFSFWRLWMGVAVFGVAVLVQRTRGSGRVDPGAWRWPLLAGVAFGLHQLSLFTAVKLTTVAAVTLIGALSPVVTGLLAMPVFAERPGPRFRLWAVVAMGGSAVVVVGGSTGPSGNPLGMALALANVVLFAVFFLVSKASRPHLGTLPFLGGTLTVAAVVVSAYVALLGDTPGTAQPTDLLYAAIIAAGPGFIGHVVMTWPLQWVPANIPPVMRWPSRCSPGRGRGCSSARRSAGPTWWGERSSWPAWPAPYCPATVARSWRPNSARPSRTTVDRPTLAVPDASMVRRVFLGVERRSAGVCGAAGTGEGVHECVGAVGGQALAHDRRQRSAHASLGLGQVDPQMWRSTATTSTTRAPRRPARRGQLSGPPSSSAGMTTWGWLASRCSHHAGRGGHSIGESQPRRRHFVVEQPDALAKGQGVDHEEDRERWVTGSASGCP